jgi:cytochrome c553
VGIVSGRRVLASAGFVLALSLSLSSAARAAGPSSKVAWTLETVRAVRAGDAVAGQKLHGDCAQCHGDKAIADTPDVPTLAGQDALYTYKQLQDYKAGLRASPIMGEAVASLSDKDMANLAVFYSKLPPPPPPAKPAPAAGSIAKLVSLGDGARLIPACDSCHGPRGAGIRGFYGMPALKSQKIEDLSTELKNFRSGDRANDVYRVMRDPAKGLTDAEIAALAAYYGTK